MKQLRWLYMVTLALSLTACEAPTGDVVELQLYTSVPLPAVQEVKLAFEKEHPSIKLSISRSGTIKTMKRISDEAAAGKVQADVIWLSDFSNAEQLKHQGLLQPYQSPEAAAIYPLFRDAEYFYTGSRLLNMVIIYNSRLLNTPPRNYRELLEPRWKGRVGLVNPNTSGSSFYTLASLWLNPEYGEGFIADLLNQQSVFVANNRTLVEKIAGGELCLGIGIDFIARDLRTDYPELPLSYVYPRSGTVVVASPIAISRDSSQPLAAQTFVDWVISKPGQSLLSKVLGIVSVRDDVASPRGMISLKDMAVIRTDARQIADQQVLIQQRLQALGKPGKTGTCEAQ